jgi:hypothetical protein
MHIIVRNIGTIWVFKMYICTVDRKRKMITKIALSKWPIFVYAQIYYIDGRYEITKSPIYLLLYYRFYCLYIFVKKKKKRKEKQTYKI